MMEQQEEPQLGSILQSQILQMHTFTLFLV